MFSATRNLRQIRFKITSTKILKNEARQRTATGEGASPLSTDGWIDTSQWFIVLTLLQSTAVTSNSQNTL
jgi:hypothetical protein